MGRCPGMPRRLVLAAVLLALCAVTAACQARLPDAPGCPVLPDDNIWHADVSKLPVDPRSSAYVAAIGDSAPLKADFGSGLWDGGPIGIPYAVVDSHTPRVAVSFDYADESDAGPYPIPKDVPIEGGPRATATATCCSSTRSRARSTSSSPRPRRTTARGTPAPARSGT